MQSLDKIKKVHLVGVGGIMMSAMARYFLAQNVSVSGSDREESQIVKDLRKEGVKFLAGHKVSNVKKDVDLVIYTRALSKYNPELEAAKKLNLKTATVYKVLGELSKDKSTIAVAGIHGKSTTTTMIGLISEAAGFKPSVFVGTQVKEWKSNFRFGKSNLLISEACEYKDNFLALKPKIGVITNIEAEHLDYFKNLDRLIKSFQKFAAGIKRDGYLIVNGDNQYSLNIKGGAARRICFGQGKENDFRAEKIKLGPAGSSFVVNCPSFMRYNNCEFRLNIPGLFNIYNALAAISTAAVMGVEQEITERCLENFGGIWRRFEFVGIKNKIEYYNDYAHHPTEIKATLEAAKLKFGDKNWWLVYQPHLYSRTADFLESFARELSAAPNLILASIYPAREENKRGIESSDLAELINKHYPRRRPAIYLGEGYKKDVKNNYKLIRQYLKDKVKPGEIVMIMGAGDVDKILKAEQ